MSLFRKTRPGSADVERIKSEVARLNELMESQAQRALELEQSLRARDESPTETTTEAEPDAAAQAAVALAERVEAVAAQLSALDARLTAVSNELAAQLGELGSELDNLGNGQGAAVDEDTIESLRDGQLRLANEQVRYQIAFREDLARLAEQLRRP